MSRISHAVVRPVSQDLRTGKWETDILTLCGLPPSFDAPFSTKQRHVTCPECRASDYFSLLIGDNEEVPDGGK